MLVDLVRVTAADGVRLDGSCQRPTAAGGGPLDAAVCVHGTGSNFYGSTLFDALGEALLGMGVAVVRVNTRGHDLMSAAATPRGGRRLGAAYEVLDDCRLDLAAWADWARQACGPRVGLIGHSSGAVKSLYAAAHGLGVAAVVAVSPPILSHSWFAQGDGSREFLETFSRAVALAEAGEPAALLDVRVPLPFVIAASGFVEKYGPDERYDYRKFLGRVACPVLVTLGEAEVATNPAFQGAPRALAEAAPGVEVVTVAGADHFYSGGREALIEAVGGWLRRRVERRA